jgi:hypothetical protein
VNRIPEPSIFRVINVVSRFFQINIFSQDGNPDKNIGIVEVIPMEQSAICGVIECFGQFGLIMVAD